MPFPRSIALLAAALTALLLWWPGSAPAGDGPGPTATVVSVGDGDTIRVRQDGLLLTVRLACIDAPELDQGSEGRRSRNSLSLRLPQGRSVRLRVVDRDHYGRLVAEVFSDTNLNLAQVEDGQAFVYSRFVNQCDAAEYLAAEFRASRHRFGVWQQQGGLQRPWDFRRQRRNATRK